MVVSCARCGAYLVPGQAACPRCGVPRDAASPVPPSYAVPPQGPPPGWQGPPPGWQGPPPGYGAAPPARSRVSAGTVLAVGALAVVLVAAVATAWWFVLPGRGGDEAMYYGAPVDLGAPVEEEPEEAWTWTPEAATSVGAYPDDAVIDDGIVVRWNRGQDYDSPGSVALLDSDGDERWTVDFERASFVASTDDEVVLGYGIGDVEDDAPGVVEARDPDSGELLWEEESTYAGSLPEEDVVLVGDGEDAVRALDLESGEELWSAGDVLGARFGQDGELVLLGADAVRRVDARSGDEGWRTGLEVEQPSLSVAGQMVVLGGEDGAQAVDLSDGDPLWTDGEVAGMTTAWALHDGRVLGATPYSVSTGAGDTGPEDRTGWVLDVEGPVGDELVLPGGRDDPWSWTDDEDLLAVGGVLYDEDLEVLTDDYVSVLPTTDGFYGVTEDGTVSLLPGPDALDEPSWSADLLAGEDVVASVSAVDEGLLLVEGGTVRCLR